MFGGYGVADASRGWGAYDGVDMHGKVIVRAGQRPGLRGRPRPRLRGTPHGAGGTRRHQVRGRGTSRRARRARHPRRCGGELSVPAGGKRRRPARLRAGAAQAFAAAVHRVAARRRGDGPALARRPRPRDVEAARPGSFVSCVRDRRRDGERGRRREDDRRREPQRACADYRGVTPGRVRALRRALGRQRTQRPGCQGRPDPQWRGRQRHRHGRGARDRPRLREGPEACAHRDLRRVDRRGKRPARRRSLRGEPDLSAGPDCRP